MTKVFLILLVICNVAATVQAQDEKIDTDRPDQTESSVIVPRHYFQAEFGFNKENFGRNNYDLIHPTALLKYGMKRFELRLEATYKTSYEQLIPDPKSTTGLEPIEIGFKASLWEEKKILPKTSLIVHVGIPAFGSKVFSPDHLIPSFRFTMQNSITEKIAVGYNLGAEWDGFTSTPTWIYTLAPGINLGEKWYSYVEAFGFIKRKELPQHNVDAGIAYYFSPNTKIDISGGKSINKNRKEWYFAAGFSFRVPVAKKNDR